MTRLVVIGDALLDRDLHGRAERLAPDAPVPVVDAMEPVARAGGAGLAALLAARAGVDVTLVTALGADAAGEELRTLLRGVDVIDLGLHGATPEKIRVLAGGRPVVRLDRGGESCGCGPLPAGALDGADAVLVSDYGRGVAAEPTVRAALADLDVPLIWDPHPKGPEPVRGATLVTPNLKEATASASTSGEDSALAAGETAGRVLAERWRAVAVAVTLSERGAVVVSGDSPALAVPAPRVAGGDPCGAGDCFAATAAARIAQGALPSEAVRAAVDAASAFVAGDDTPRRHEGDARAVAERVRAAGGTVVATGGCFDLLHAGHVRMLEQARALGDCLIVCLNSDASVARLKGDDRPLVEQEDRAAVLNGLACVDAVVVFDEDDPRAVLETIRPHVWAKGGDYAVGELPEAETLARWGGRAVIVPYVAGRSTTRLITEVLARAR
ncbi:rfaE bifunctional protein kinase chain/domain/rfaE bifunctional protein nucleotidyltransferase chain/domain [Solirubrobacter pauli]|uniref:D-glycero-beta-D-manno-heptose 1-phosphate adenylyltransferase n=1 Tax=Solirubrobacter pauli TaxID=166793 RepID=A0A660LHQ8_9ACTN|nr:D-glycero-beta-D-manno-heptose 1-phosphate adenylyltransferase [Solirubrobacter pauli]RKQ93906.1 rfaE bifunctional protein kinase chain/domain/rfaE bifunctional protein nucleotidyltransferase chain/domain [Solirubrobacter pauli]